MVDLAPFQLTPTQLRDIRDAMAQAIQAGFSSDGQQVAALPAYLAPPRTDLVGEALVVDTGGTNMRAAWVELGPGDTSRIKAGPIAKRLELRGDKRVDREGFFRMQADLVDALGAPKGLPVGYCFSYPSEVLPNLDARLIKWTKGLDLPDVVGTLVGDGLHKALAAHEPLDVRVLNDTVAALLYASLISSGDNPAHAVGLIVGTGTNMACYASAANAPKLTADGIQGTIAINLESGNFSPPHLTVFDDIVDRESNNPGQQRFEKSVSGFYLPFIYRAALGNPPDVDPHLGTQILVDKRTQALDTEEGQLAAALLDRAADIVGAGLAAVIAQYTDARHVTILSEGSLFWRPPGFADRAQATLRSLLPESIDFSVHRMVDANLFGAAAAALSR